MTNAPNDQLSSTHPVPRPLDVNLYSRLREIAALHLRRERPDHTLQPTALAHEAYLRLARDRAAQTLDSPEFLAAAVIAIRRVLIDHARRRRALKRTIAGLDLVDPVTPGDPEIDAIDRFDHLHAALRRYRRLDPRRCAVIELRVFAALTIDQTASVLGLARSTVTEDLRLARAWLTRALETDPYAPPRA